MAKKQRRYRKPGLERIFPDLIGETVSLILSGRQVFQLKVLALEGGSLEGSDGLQRRHCFPLALIEEVIVDIQA